MDRETRNLPTQAIRAINAPVLILMGDSDIFHPEQALEMVRLFGGIPGDTPAGLPASQLAILSGTFHVTLVYRADLKLPMIPPFLDTPANAA